MFIHTVFLGNLQFGSGLSYSFANKNIIFPGSLLENKEIRILRLNVNLTWYTDILPLPIVEYCIRTNSYAVDGHQNLIATGSGDKNIDTFLAYKNLQQLSGTDFESYDLSPRGFLLKNTSPGLYLNAQISSYDNQIISFTNSILDATVQILYEKEFN